MNPSKIKEDWACDVSQCEIHEGEICYSCEADDHEGEPYYECVSCAENKPVSVP